MTDIALEYLFRLHGGAAEQGLQLTPLLKRAGVSPGLPGDMSSKVTYTQLSMFYKGLWLATGDEYLGFTKRPCKLGTFRLMADILSRHYCLEDVLRDAARFYQLTRDDTDFDFVSEGSLVRVRVQMDTLPLDRDYLLQEYMVMAWQQYLNWLVGMSIPWDTTFFRYMKPDSDRLFPSRFHGRVLFLQDYSGFAFDSKYLRLQIRRSRDEVDQFLKMLPLPLLAPSVSHNAPFSMKVRQILASESSHEALDLAGVAKRLSINPRTVHRKLTGEGSSFQQLKTRYRIELATECLLHRQMNTRETSDYLGFSEPSAFCRFFKAEVGLSPSQFSNLDLD